MNDETCEWEDDDFVAVAVRHGIIRRAPGERISEYAREHEVQPADAALTLSMLEPHEVDAIELLCQPSKLAPGYQLTGLIGCGTGGMVFRAWQSTMGRDVALKTINIRRSQTSATGKSRLQREAHAIARLHHPNIVAAFDSGFHQGRFCIAMELVEGQTLAEYIERRGTIAEDVVWQIARQVASALAHAEAEGIIHRDIKPANLLLCEAPMGIGLPEGVPFVKVADFGLAFESDDVEGSLVTAVGTTLGTPAYVAPEQLRDTHVDARADIYALGATVFHMLTGVPPCADRSPMRTILQKTIGDDLWRDEISPTISDVTRSLFRDMTESELPDRIGGYAELTRRIDEILQSPAVGRATSESLSRPSGSKAIPRRLIPVAIGGVAASLLAIGAWTFIEAESRFAVKSAQGDGPEVKVRLQDLVVDGFPQPLFNGKSVPLFLQSGSWSPGTASDGGRVLEGKRGAHMTIPLAVPKSSARDTRLRMGVHVEEDSVVEIAIRGSDVEAEGMKLRIGPDMIEFRQATAGGEPGESLPQTTVRSSTGDVTFQRIAFMRFGAKIWVLANGEIMGSAACQDDFDPSVVLRCVRNNACFADIDVVALRAKNGSLDGAVLAQP
ncbi:MAG: serine/threonine-protein kinase [Planctomycetota bacterium]